MTSTWRASTRSFAVLLRAGTQIFVMGGDHGVTIPVLDALDELQTPSPYRAHRRPP
jgi:arginase family enzyme